MKSRRRFHIPALLFMLFWTMLPLCNEGCAWWGRDKVIGMRNAGLTIDAEIKNDPSVTTNIHTTTGIIVIKGSHPIFTGKKCSIILYENKKPDLCVDGETFCWEIIKRY